MHKIWINFVIWFQSAIPGGINGLVMALVYVTIELLMELLPVNYAILQSGSPITIH